MSQARITLRRVAERAGVAESTASRALAGSGQISPLTRQRVAAAAEALGYDLGARAKVRPDQRMGVIGVVVAALHNSFYPYLVDRLHDELDELGYDMVLIIDEVTRDRAGRKLRALVGSLDGVVVTTSLIGSPTVDFLVEQGLPTVLAIRSNERGNVDVVESDNRTAGAEAMRHLVELGHRRVGFLLGPAQTSTSARRMEGALAVLEAAGLGHDPDLVTWGEFTHDGGYSGLVRLMRGANPPTAVFCANDVIAIGALEACRRLGLRVPQDVSITGVDDIPMAAWAMIDLTTVRQPLAEIGSLAARLLVERIEGHGPEKPVHQILPTRLVRRGSTGAGPTRSA